MSAGPSGGRAIPEGVEEAIENQRLQLIRASSVLTCLWIASLYQEWHDVQIDASGVALIVRRMIDDAVDALDMVELARVAEEPLERDEGKVPDEDQD